MGRQTFNVISFGKTADDAITHAVHEADRYYGHQGGYSGQINSNTGTGFMEIKDHPRVYTKKFNKWYDNFIKNIGDETFYIEITGSKAIELKKENCLAKTRNKVFLLFGTARC